MSGLREGCRKQRARDRPLWGARDCPTEPFDRLIVLMQEQQREPLLQMKDVQQWVAGAEPHCLVGILDGLLRLTQIAARKTQVAISIHKAGVERQAEIRLHDGLLEAVLCYEDQGT